MNALFVNTAGWMACADAADPDHATAAAARDAALASGRLLVTTDYVIDETLTLVRLSLGLDAARAWWQQIDGSTRLRWEPIDSARFESARMLFFKYRDKPFSFTDCTSFAVIEEDLSLREALTTDRHFQQAGFTAVPGGARRRRK